MGPVRALTACLLLWQAGCDSQVKDVTPVGGDQVSPVEQERFLGRLHLDLTGTRASDDWIAGGLARFDSDGGTAETRAAMAEPLIDSAEFAELWAGELENGIFGGETAENRYDLLCGILRSSDPACVACPAPSSGDVCGDCGCPALTSIVSERAELRAAAADLADGSTTSEIGRRFASSQAFRNLQDPDTTTTLLFEQFIGRPAEPEELRNGRQMVFGLALPGSPSGLLFHRHGTDYADLLDIIFESELYREARVAAVFQRYLGRTPSAAERAHFAAELDPDDADVRPLVRAVVSSREYFEQ